MINSVWELPIDLDALVAATEACLPGYLPGFIEFEQVRVIVGGVTYKLKHYELGEVGEVIVRKIRAGESQIMFKDAPIPLGRAPTSNEMAEIEAMTDENERLNAQSALFSKIRSRTR